MPSLNHDQQRAIAALERAFHRCAACNLRFAGMDGNILAWDPAEWDRITGGGQTNIVDGQHGKAPNRGHPVNTHGCYMDSGGW